MGEENIGLFMNRLEVD